MIYFVCQEDDTVDSFDLIYLFSLSFLLLLRLRLGVARTGALLEENHKEWTTNFETFLSMMVELS